MSSEDAMEAIYEEMYDQSTVSRRDDIYDCVQANLEDLAEKLMSSQKMREITDQLQCQESHIAKLSTENENLRKRLAIAEGAVTRSELKIRQLEDKVTDLTCRSMRDNLIIKNMKESDNESTSSLDANVKKFFSCELKITADAIRCYCNRKASLATNNRERNLLLIVWAKQS